MLHLGTRRRLGTTLDSFWNRESPSYMQLLGPGAELEAGMKLIFCPLVLTL